MKNLAAYDKIIAKILRDSSGKGRTPEQVADSIIQRIAALEEDLALMGGAPTLIDAAPPRPAPSRTISQDLDASQRLTAPDKIEDGLVEKWTKDQLLDFARNELPEILQVSPPGFSEPFRIRKFIESAPGDLGYVRVTYQQVEAPITTQEGQRVGPTIQVSTTDKVLDPEQLTTDVIQQADSMYTKTPRVLVPKAPMISSRPGDLSNAVSAESTGAPIGMEQHGAGEDGLTFKDLQQQRGGGDFSQSWRSQRG